MNIEMIIPWRDSGCKYRKRSFDFIYKLYSSEFKITVSDSEHENFNRAAARNRGVYSSNADIVVVTDADLFVPINQINFAIDTVANVDGQIKPFTQFGHLNKTATEYFIKHEDKSTITSTRFETLSTLWPGIHGGTFIMKRKDWIATGGMDERFLGWGAEDNAFNVECEKKYGPIKTVSGYAYHLFHPHKRRQSAENTKLLEQHKK